MSSFLIQKTDFHFIKQLYKGILSRNFDSGDVTQDEINYWLGELNGKHSGNKGALALSMINVIRNYSDANTGFTAETHAKGIKARDQFKNKVKVASHYAYKDSSDGSSNEFSGSYQESKNLLLDVTEDPDTVEDAIDF